MTQSKDPPKAGGQNGAPPRDRESLAALRQSKPPARVTPPPPLPHFGIEGRTPAKKSFWERVAASLKPPRKLKFTREGKYYLGITLGVGFAAINTGNNLLYLLLGMLLSLIVVSSVMSELSLRQLTVTRRLPMRAQVGRAHLVEIEVFNHSSTTRSESPRTPSRSRISGPRSRPISAASSSKSPRRRRRSPPIAGRPPSEAATGTPASVSPRAFRSASSRNRARSRPRAISSSTRPSIPSASPSMSRAAARAAARSGEAAATRRSA